MKQTLFLLIFTLAGCAFGTEPAAKLPSRDPATVLSLLRALPPTSTYSDVCRILGTPDLDVGSASPNASFTLADGSRVHVTTRATQDLIYRVRTITLHPPRRAVVEGEGSVLFDTTPKS